MKNPQFLSLLLFTSVLCFSLHGEEAKQSEHLNWMKSPAVFRQAMNDVLPSLVSIEAFGSAQAPTTKRGRGAINGLGRLGNGPTTGVIYATDENKTYLITSTFQFLTKPVLITVTFDQSDRRVGKILGKDDTRKICVVAVDSKPEDADRLATFLPEQAVRVGQYAITVGLGYGADEPAMSVGIVSGLNRMFGKAIQTDANISPANYGGPLLDLDGRIMGICVPYSPFGKQPFAGVEWYDSGIGFAVSIEEHTSLIKRLIDGETLKPGIMGVVVKIEGNALLVDKVAPKSGADKAGLEKGDIIFMVNKRKIATLRDLKLTLGRHVAGETVKVYYRRGDRIGEAEVELQAGSNMSYKSETPDMIKRVFPDKKKK